MFAIEVLGDAELLPRCVYPTCPSCKAPIRKMAANLITGHGQFPDKGTITKLMYTCSGCGAVLGISSY